MLWWMHVECKDGFSYQIHILFPLGMHNKKVCQVTGIYGSSRLYILIWQRKVSWNLSSDLSNDLLYRLCNREQKKPMISYFTWFYNQFIILALGHTSLDLWILWKKKIKFLQLLYYQDSHSKSAETMLTSSSLSFTILRPIPPGKHGKLI